MDFTFEEPPEEAEDLTTTPPNQMQRFRQWLADNPGKWAKFAGKGAMVYERSATNATLKNWEKEGFEIRRKADPEDRENSNPRYEAWAMWPEGKKYEPRQHAKPGRKAKSANLPTDDDRDLLSDDEGEIDPTEPAAAPQPAVPTFDPFDNSGPKLPSAPPAPPAPSNGTAFQKSWTE